MNILYGVVGDGMGHATRSAVFIRKLLRDGHDVHIVTYGDPVDYLREQFPEVTEIWGLETVTDDNVVSAPKTLLQNVKKGLPSLPSNIRKFFSVTRQFEPDAVVSDFEFWSWCFAKWHRVPFISVANQHLMTRCRHPSDLFEPEDDRLRRPAEMFARARNPAADHYLVPSFARPEEVEPRTTIIPPLVRRQVLDAETSWKDYLLVYQTSYTSLDLVSELQKLDIPVRAYGLEDVESGSIRQGNVLHRSFGERQFIEDLAGCRGIVASSGFTLISEALALGKPYLAVPVEEHIEQIINARYLDYLNYGACEFRADAGAMQHFVDRLPRYRERLETYEHEDNSRAFRRLDSLLERFAAREPRYASAPGE